MAMPEVFRKTLRATDVKNRFSFPTKKLVHFEMPENQLSKDLYVFDMNDSNRRSWRFNCSKRDPQKNARPHPKPVLTAGSIDFVTAKGLGIHDVVTFYKGYDGNGNPIFMIRAQKHRSVFRLFGVDHEVQMVDV